jgi:DNA-directed RNA polymerase I, II, and III subunit RPABC1
MQNTNTLLFTQIYNSRKNVLELMEKQGYDILGHDKFSVNELNTMIQKNQLDMLLESKSNKIYIRYYLGKTFRPQNIHDLIEDLFIVTETLNKKDTLYIILKDNPNETIVEELKHIWKKDGIFIVVESIKQLQFNILNHILVPKHSIMTEVEENEILTKYKLEKNQLPDISRFDPVARAICLRPGQMCKIERPSKTAIVSIYYRVCT